MDEYNRGMDPEIKRYFKKIINSFSYGALWLLIIATAGLFFGLGIATNGMKWYNIVFYAVAGLSFMGLIYYYYRLWNKRD
jgi:amino acid transporter